LMDLAELSLRRGRTDEALLYGRAAMARAETARGDQLLGMILLKRGDQVAAMPYLQRAAAAMPGARRVGAPLRQ
jgi:hypothetical protein